MREIPVLKIGTAMAAGIGIGAALMYVFDPVSGKRRRAFARDKCVAAAGDAIGPAEAKERDLRNRVRGTVPEAKDTLTPNRADIE
jgi:hypothetical protein